MYLVCDGGGTKTDFLLFDAAGRVLGRAGQGGANANFVPVGQAAEAVQRGIEACLSMARVSVAEVESIVLFIPGFAPALGQVQAHFGRADIRQMGDEKNAFYAALGAPHGIAVLSGTGSFAVGRDAAGRSACAGGWGPLFSDEGSGYHIGVLCLSRLARLHDAGVHGTPLEGAALSYLGLPDVASLRSAAYKPDFTRRRVAGLCPVVGGAAREGDANACAILDEAARSLAQLASAVAGQLDARGLPVALTGGVARMGEVFTGRFAREVRRALPQCVCQSAKYSPVVGAALCVLSEMAGVDITAPEIAENLKKAELGDTNVDG